MHYFLKYACVGISGTVISAVILYILVTFFSVPLLVGVGISFIIATTSNFILNKIWTFRDKATDDVVQYLTYLAISIVGFFITLELVPLFVTLYDIWFVWATIMTSFALMFFNFTANSLVTFRDKN